MKESFKIPQHQTTTEDPHNDVNEDDLNVSSGDLREDRIPNTLNLDFMRSHPGDCFTKLSHLKNWIVQMMDCDDTRLCSISKLQICDVEFNKNINELREDYMTT